MSCPFCGITSIQPGARYCHHCGGPLSPVASLPATERRVVTVLFCDLSDFTAWSEEQDPERVSAVTDRVLAECAQAVSEFGGHVDKLTGDGLMAVFGAPVAHDDDAERAVRAAQRMRRAVRKLLKTESGGGLPMGLRVGMRSGLVVAGMQASVEYTVVGDTVNTAARLADVAEVGTVYASAETMRATKHIAAWRRLNPVRLKGKREPVEVYELLGLQDEPGTRATLGDRAPFVGREPEMGRLTGRLDAVIDRAQPLTLVMTGEPGIGKTRMALEGARMAIGRGARVLSVRAVAYGQGYRLGPLADLVRKAAGISIGDDRAVAERQLRKVIERHSHDEDSMPGVLNVDTLLAMLGYGPAPMSDGRQRPTTTTGNEGTAVPQMAAELFNLLAKEGPLVLMIDDLHVATSQALDALGSALAGLSGPILVAILGRPSLVRTAGLLTRLSEAEAYTLSPLRGADAARLLSAFCDNGRVDGEDESRLLATAQGNPYYLAELVTLLVERGMLTERGGLWQLEPGSLTGRLLSADLARVLTARIDALPPDARELLREVSVIGDAIPEAAMEVLDNDIPGALDELLARRMLRRRTHGGYRFVTPLMREAAYAGLGKADLATRHARLARWAARTDGLDEARADDFTISHAVRALRLAKDMELPVDSPAYGVASIAIKAFGRAARREMDAGEPEGALSLLEESARVAPLPAVDRLVLARALLRLGRTADALSELQPLGKEFGLTPPLDIEVVVPETPDNPAHAAQTLMLAGRAYRTMGEPEQSRRVWQRSLLIAREAGLVSEQADVLCRLGMFDYLSGRLRGAEERFETALKVATAGGDSRAEAWALQHLAWAYTSLGDFEGADSALRQATRLFAVRRDMMGRAWVRSSAAFVRLLAGRLREAKRLAEAFRPFGEMVGDPWAVGMLRSVGAYASADLGDLTDADALVRKGFRDFDRIGDDWGRGFTLVVRGVIARDLGELDHALELVTEAEAYAAESSHPLLIGVAGTLRGYCLLEMGEAQGAEAAAKTTLSLATPHDVLEPVKVGPLSLLAEARAMQGDTATALRWFAQIAERADSPALLFSRRRAVARYAQLLWRDGRTVEARDWAQRALDAPGEDAKSARFVREVLHETGALQPSPLLS